jgi:hypothetical protein
MPGRLTVKRLDDDGNCLLRSLTLLVAHESKQNTRIKKAVVYIYAYTRVFMIFFLISWDGVRLSPLCTSSTNRPILPPPGDRRWVWRSGWNKNWQERPKYPEKTFSSATLSATNPTWPELGSNPGLRRGKPASNRLSYGTASCVNYNQLCIYEWEITVYCIIITGLPLKRQLIFY